MILPHCRQLADSPSATHLRPVPPQKKKKKVYCPEGGRPIPTLGSTFDTATAAWTCHHRIPLGASPFGPTLVCFHASCWAPFPVVGSPKSLGHWCRGKGFEVGERAQEGLSGGAMPSVSRAPCWVGFQWVGVEWGTRQLGRRNIQGSKEGWACSTGQNNAEGQVFRAKADQPAFVAWTAGVCCRMTRRINVPH